MHKLFPLAFVCVLVGCAGSPPKPPACQGEFRPINVEQQRPALSITTSMSLCTGDDHGRG